MLNAPAAFPFVPHFFACNLLCQLLLVCYWCWLVCCWLPGFEVANWTNMDSRDRWSDAHSIADRLSVCLSGLGLGVYAWESHHYPRRAALVIRLVGLKTVVTAAVAMYHSETAFVRGLLCVVKTCLKCAMYGNDCLTPMHHSQCLMELAGTRLIISRSPRENELMLHLSLIHMILENEMLHFHSQVVNHYHCMPSYNGKTMYSHFRCPSVAVHDEMLRHRIRMASALLLVEPQIDLRWELHFFPPHNRSPTKTAFRACSKDSHRSPHRQFCSSICGVRCASW